MTKKTCKQHPKYKGIKEPSVDCLDCWKIYAKHQKSLQYKIEPKIIKKYIPLQDTWESGTNLG